MIGKVYSPISPSRLMVNKGECPFLLLSPEQTMYVWSLLSPSSSPRSYRQGEVHSFRSTLMAFALSDFIHFLRFMPSVAVSGVGLGRLWFLGSQSLIRQFNFVLWSKVLNFRS